MSYQGYIPRPAGQESIFDMGRLAELKRQTQQGGPEANKQTARQFEALFLQMMVKRMRAALPKEGLFHSQQTEMVQSMADEQLALQLSDPGMGLARAIVAQMQQQGGGNAASTPAVGQGAAGAATPAASSRAALAMTLAGQRDGRMPVSTAMSPMQAAVPRREVAALLDVLRNNRAQNRAVAVAEGAPEHVVDFVSRMSHAANRAAQHSGVPARLILGQAALESGWGRREILHPDGSPSHNLFGIKAGPDWKGKVVNVTTTEYVDGQPQKMVQPFRAYKSYEESFSDYAKLIGNSPRYAHVTQASNEIEAARRIQQAGYATDPNYADKLIQIMSQMKAAVGPLAFSAHR